MIIVVDGYNVLKQVKGAREISNSERERFIALLHQYGKLKGNKIVLFFDGGLTQWPSRERHKGIEVIYSGITQSADDCIKHYLKDHPNYDLLLVTSDHELGLWASHIQVPSINSIDFYQLMIREHSNAHTSNQQQHQGQLIKTSYESDESVDRLMQETVEVIHSKKDDIIAVPRTAVDNQRLSKKERKLLQKIKKL